MGYHTLCMRSRRLHGKLWQLFRVIWRKWEISECWKEAEECFVPKEQNSVTINKFRTISLLNVEVNMYIIYTKGWHTRVLRIHRTHRCHKPAHQRGTERQEELCNSVVRPKIRLRICIPQSDWVSDGVVTYTREGPEDCQELFWMDEDPVKMQIQRQEIPSIIGTPIKCLGKLFNKSLTDKDST